MPEYYKYTGSHVRCFTYKSETEAINHAEELASTEWITQVIKSENSAFYQNDSEPSEELYRQTNEVRYIVFATKNRGNGW